MDIMASFGSISLGSRLKRLSDQLFQEVTSIYGQAGVSLQPSYFPLFYLLFRQGTISVTDASEALCVSHPAVSKMAQKMIREGWIIKTPDPEDERTQKLSFTEQSKNLLPKLKPIWKELSKAVDELQEGIKAATLTEHILAIEQRLQETSLSQQVLERLNDPRLNGAITIVGWDPKYAEAFRQLNQEWLDHYFPDQQAQRDKESLGNPGGYYLSRGGSIFFALINGAPVGTCALARVSDDLFEISKTGVTPSAQSKGIGRRLMLETLAEARRLGAKQVFLESNRKLLHAQKLYRKLGFCETAHPLGKSEYERSDIYMILTL
ncbi:bifunctional helix-turn-helix transcriptional regulator/GNAT family N-acetyltransferase [Kiloniella laminariae]|uniref:Bifunctional helix-turn-helix transcriptional regulator/GNAT family N-acetyltransferase n=1 Tax=Kiloniella laminariae TaxID=454162 RepID=A0ABT4LKF2_9PROT|nr:bifunctional helix-turn-helix transcriptional regulator/GNAT family N-acetyltransferase [Kiloniella laminariae]MCZ4281552.1 bifunctional helix-turn-helix transcriptional regulator/GNAT family N-acetyltransferase [Kiloniella laminariae]